MQSKKRIELGSNIKKSINAIIKHKQPIIIIDVVDVDFIVVVFC